MLEDALQQLVRYVCSTGLHNLFKNWVCVCVVINFGYKYGDV